MTWFRLDDTWLMHPKVQAAGLKGRALWIAGGLHCAQQLTDGRIDKALVPVLASQAGVAARDARVLVDVGLWEEEGDHYLMHHWHDYQPSREKVNQDRAAAAERQKRARDKARESHEKSRRDSHVTNGVSHGPPDPTRPVKENAAPREPETDTANAALLAEARDIVEQRRDLETEAATKANPGGWLATTRKAIDLDVLQAEARWPGVEPATALQLADMVQPVTSEPPPPVTTSSDASAVARNAAARTQPVDSARLVEDEHGGITLLPEPRTPLALVPDTSTGEPT